MSALLMGRVFYADLPGHLKLCLLALADHARDDGTRVFIGQTTLAQKIGRSARTVRRFVDALTAAGYLIPEPRRGAHGTNHYRLDVAKLPFPDPRPAESRPATIVTDRPECPTGQNDVVDRTKSLCRPDTAVSDKPSVRTKNLEAGARRTRLPASFALDTDLRKIAAEKGCRAPDVLFAAFVDYWRAEGTVKADWIATFRVWAGRAHGGPPRLACSCGGLPRTARASSRYLPAEVPEDKPERTAEAKAKVRAIMESLPWAK